MWQTGEGTSFAATAHVFTAAYVFVNPCLWIRSKLHLRVGTEFTPGLSTSSDMFVVEVTFP
jgi:hypothetical protein